MEFSPTKISFIGIHKIIGTIIFALIIARLVWRFINRKPNSGDLSLIHKIFSRVAHFILYAIVIFIPIQGTMMTQAGGFNVNILGIISVPKIIATNKEMYPTFVEFHYILMIILTIVFLLHLSGGLYHRFIIKDKFGAWNRMSFWGKN
jgi:cytochrome b561